jgi:hypothetical protein
VKEAIQASGRNATLILRPPSDPVPPLIAGLLERVYPSLVMSRAAYRDLPVCSHFRFVPMWKACATVCGAGVWEGGEGCLHACVHASACVRSDLCLSV